MITTVVFIQHYHTTTTQCVVFIPHLYIAMTQCVVFIQQSTTVLQHLCTIRV